MFEKSISIKRHQIWQRPFILKRFSKFSSGEDSSDSIKSKSIYLRDLDLLYSRMKKFENATTLEQSRSEFRRCATILKAYRATAPRSRLRFLSSRLCIIMGNKELEFGDSAYLVSWYKGMADFYSEGGSSVKKDGPAADLYASQSMKPPRNFHDHATAFRLRGQYFEHRALLGSEVEIQSPEYESLAGHLQLSQSFQGLSFSKNLYEECRSSRERGEALFLWLKLCHPRRDIPFHFESLASAFDRSLFKPATGDGFFTILDKMGRTVVQSLGVLCDSEASVLSKELSLLRLGIYSFWLKSHGVLQLFGGVADLYRAASLTLSDGRFEDALLHGNKVEGNVTASRSVPVSPLPSGKIVRMFACSQLSWLLAKGLGRERLKKLFRLNSQTKRLDTSTAVQISQSVVEHLRILRGPILKVGQAASFWGPAESFSHVFKPLQAHAHSEEFSAIEQVLLRELGPEKMNLFESICPEPFAVGSVAQVHRARLRTGEDVALKIIPPGMDKVVDFDFTMLRVLCPVVRLWVPKLKFESLVNELCANVRSELDLQKEAERLEMLRPRYWEYSQIALPMLFPQLCSQSVLTMEYIEGVDFDTYVASASKKGRDDLAEKLTRLAVCSSRDGLFNTDMHPGNFIFVRGQIYAVDFGNVKELDTVTAQNWSDGIRAAIKQDKKLFLQVAERMNLFQDPREFDAELGFAIHMRNAMSLLSEDRVQSFNYEKIQKEWKQLLSRENKNLKCLRLDPQYAYPYRLYFCLFSLLARVGGEVNWHRLCDELLWQGKGE